MEELYYLGFSVFPGVGPVKFAQLLQKFGTAKDAWKGKGKDVEKIIGPKLSHEFVEFRDTFDAKAYAKILHEKHIQIVTWKNEEYPFHLKPFIPYCSSSKRSESRSTTKENLFLPPFVLYVKGDISVLHSSKTIAVVGTRKVTDYGKEITENFTRELVAQNFVIVSGLALGVDGIAHRVALENNGKTIAVLGSSVDECTPTEHQALYNQILQNHGCILSQFALNEHVGPGHFPARNKIIAGLSQGVLVTEGAEDSGALYTAKDAAKISRPVFSIPGPITSSLSKGTNNLIKNGAVTITEVGEILDRLGIIAEGKSQAPIPKSQKGGNKEEQEILDLLTKQPLHFDEIVRSLKKDSKTIGSILSVMELKGTIRSLSDGKYSLSQKSKSKSIIQN